MEAFPSAVGWARRLVLKRFREKSFVLHYYFGTVLLNFTRVSEKTGKIRHNVYLWKRARYFILQYEYCFSESLVYMQSFVLKTLRLAGPT